MKQNKKILVSLLALNSAITAYSGEITNQENIKYENLYKNMIKNMNKRGSNQKNYKIIESILKKRNKELKDLYLQSDYIVKPEYLEWQIFFNGFYENTKIGKEKKINVYDENGNIIGDRKNDSNGFGRDLRTVKEVKLGASIPLKTVKEFTLNPEINIIDKEIKPINIELPVTKVEKIRMVEPLEVNLPGIASLNVNINVSEPNIIPPSQIDFNFNAGHSAGAPPLENPNAGVKHGVSGTGILVTSLKGSDSTPNRFVVHSSIPALIFDKTSNFTLETNQNVGTYIAENAANPVLLANFGTLTLDSVSKNAYIFGDSVNGNVGTTNYNGGIFNIKSSGGGTSTSNGVGMAYFDYNGNIDSNKYIENGNIINIEGYGNYGLLAFNLDHTITKSDSLLRAIAGYDPGNPGKLLADTSGNGNIDINVILNRGKIVINKSGVSNFGNVGISAFTGYSKNFGNLDIIKDDTSFVLNHGEGTGTRDKGVIKSETGNNILMQHKGSGNIFNNGVLDISSGETVGLMRENVGNRGITRISGGNTNANVWNKQNVVSNGINDGIININGRNSGAEKIIGMKGAGYSGSGIRENVPRYNGTPNGVFQLEYNAENKVIIQNGDGKVFGLDINQDGTENSINININKGYLNQNSLSSNSANGAGLALNSMTLNADDLVSNNIYENQKTKYKINIDGTDHTYETRNGVIFLGARNSAGMYVETENILSRGSNTGLYANVQNGNINKLPGLSEISYSKAINNKDGKIFILASDNANGKYSVGMYGKYATLNNEGGIYLGLISNDTFIADSYTDVKTKAVRSDVSKNKNYIGIYGAGTDIVNNGIITDRAENSSLVGAAAENNNSIKAVGIYGIMREVNNKNSSVYAGSLKNNGQITLGEGGIGIAGYGGSNSRKISVNNTGNISIKSTGANQGVGLILDKAVLTNNGTLSSSININLGGEKATGIFAENSELAISYTNIGEEVFSKATESMGIGLKDSKLNLGEKMVIEISGDKSQGIYGDGIVYQDNSSTDRLEIKLSGKGSTGIYLKNQNTDINLKAKSITLGNSFDSTDYSVGAYIKGTGKVSLETGDIKIGTAQTDGQAFGIYVESGTGTNNGKITTGDIIITENSSVGVYGENVKDINTGNISSGKIGMYQINTGSAGTLTAGRMSVKGNVDNVVGIYTSDDGIIDVSIAGMEVSGKNNTTGIYVKRGGFETAGDININGLDNSYGVFIQGDSGLNNINFNNKNIDINLGNDSIGAYFNNAAVNNGMINNIIVGDSTDATIMQSVGLYAENVTFGTDINTNINAGKETIGVYMKNGTGNVTLNGNITVGNKSLGIYKEGGTVTRDPSKSLIFSGTENNSSVGVYLNNSILDYSSANFNQNTLKMNEGVAFYLKGNNSRVTVNGLNITDAELDMMGLNPKVERFVYSDKNQLIIENIQLDPGKRYYGHHIKEGRLEVNANITVTNEIEKTYGILAEGRYNNPSYNEEAYLVSGKVIDMGNSKGSIGIEALDGARVKNDGKIIVGRSNNISSGVGILGESTTLYETKIENNGQIQMTDAGIGIYLDYADKGGKVYNNNKIESLSTRTLGIYSQLTNSVSPLSVPKAEIYNNGDIVLADGSVGIFSENTKIENSGNIKVGNSTLTGSSVGIYGNKKSEIKNTSGNIEIGNDGVAFYGDDSKIDILGGIFNVISGTMIYGINGTDVNFGVNGVVLGERIGIYLENSKINLNGNSLELLDNGLGIYAAGNSDITNLGTLRMKNNSQGIYLKENNTGTIGGRIEMNGINSNGIVSIDSNLVNSTVIDSVSQENKGIIAKLESTNNSQVINNADITLLGERSIGIYASASDKNNNLLGTVKVQNNAEIKLGSSTDIKNASIGIYGAKNTEIENINKISGGSNVVGLFSLNGIMKNKGIIDLGDSSVGIYQMGGNSEIDVTANIKVGADRAVAIYTSEGAYVENKTSNISVGEDSIIGYIKGKGTKLLNKGDLGVNKESVAFYVSEGEIENDGKLTSLGDGIINFYGKDALILNNGEIKGADFDYGIGIYGEDSIIKNTANIFLRDSKIIDETNSANIGNRYTAGIYGSKSSIENSGNIEIGEKGIGIYSYSQTGDLINRGDIRSLKDGSIGIFSEYGGKAKGYRVLNQGSIELTGKNVIGAALYSGVKMENEGLISVNGDNAIGVYVDKDSELYNKSTGIIKATGNNSVPVVLKGGSKLINEGILDMGSGSLGLVAADETSDAGGTAWVSSGSVKLPSFGTSGNYPLPSIVNAGIIKVDGKFEVPYDGVVQVKVDPESVREPSMQEISDLSELRGKFLVSNAVHYEADEFNINDVTVTSDFSQGTNATVYKLKDVFMPGSSKAGVTSGIAKFLSQSYTWDAIPEVTSDGNLNIWMKKFDYKDLLEGYWTEDFGGILDNKYGNTGEEGDKIFDKLDKVETESEFLHGISSLAGEVYANMNRRELNIENIFSTTLEDLQNSTNNTKENVKISIITGKGKHSEKKEGLTDYNTATTGILALREVERTYKHTFGYSLGYMHTNFEFKDGNKSEELADTIQLGLHNKYKTNGWVMNNDLTSRVSLYNIDRNINWKKSERSELNGYYQTYSITSNNKIGREWDIIDNVKVIPYGEVKTSYIVRPTFNEKGAEALEIEGNDHWSVKPKLGIELSVSAPIKDTVKFKGNFDVGYEYELVNNGAEKAKIIAVEDNYHELAKMEREKGVIKTKASLGIEVEDKYGIFLTGEYSAGENKKEDYRTGITLKAVF